MEFVATTVQKPLLSSSTLSLQLSPFNRSQCSHLDRPHCNISLETVAFVLSSIAIIILTALIVDISGHLGCFINCKDIVTAFILISLGLNIPNLVGAKLASVEEETADLPLLCLLAGNVFTASFGFGSAWLLCSFSWEAQGEQFLPVGSLGFCLTEFIAIGTIAIIVLFGRRCCAGGELGGNQVCKIITTFILFLFWIYFMIFIPAEAYGFINPGM